MKWKLWVLVLLGAAGASSDLVACGNKFLVASRGTRFGRVPVERQEASILVYANPTSRMKQVLVDVPVEAILVQAGYQPRTVQSREALDEALRQGQWDLVLADLFDSATLREEMQGAGTPRIVPVLYQPTRADYSQAKKEYGIAVKAPFKSQRFITTIDDAVASVGH